MTEAKITRLENATENALGLLAAKLAEIVVPGDIFALHGTLGAGKTSFCRALIRAATNHPDEEVPSPTFTLAQPYDDPRGFTIWHFDLYRLEEPDEALELGLEDAFMDGVSLIEWPERLGDLLPADHLTVALDFAADKGRRNVSLTGGPSWTTRIAGLALDEISG